MIKKYCLITGAAGGFGKAYTTACIKRGYMPILTDYNEQKLSAFKQELVNTYDIDVITFTADMTNENGTDHIWAYLKKHDITLSLVIYTVGIEIEGMFKDLTTEYISRIIKTNVVGFTYFISRVIAYKSSHMDIINFASLAGFFSMPYKAVYAASKAYIINLSKALYVEFKNEDVNVLVICPAGVPTRQEVIDRIKRQGFYGKITTSRVEDIVNRSFVLVKKRKMIYIPRLFNKTFVLIAKVLPSKWVTKIIAKRWIPKQ